MIRLLLMVEEEGIWLSYRPLLRERGQLGLYWRDSVSGKPFIILDSNLPRRPRDERAILTEEIFHHKVGTRGTVAIYEKDYNQRDLILQSDDRALKGATEFLVPTEQLAVEVMRGRRTIYDLSETFYVPEWMMRCKARYLRTHLRTKYSVRVSTRDLFSPLLAASHWGDYAGERTIELWAELSEPS